MVYQHVLRRALFRWDPETAHERTLAALARVGGLTRVVRPFYGRGTPVEVFGVRFPGRVGLAAGVDKNGVALRAWPGLGFGFVEVGTVTARAQEGNPRPRLYRLPASEAVINRMGFNNAGAEVLASRLRGVRSVVPVGVSIGKSKVTPVSSAVSDYLTSLRVLFPYADYFAVNVSSPNTPGLRGLQDRGALDELLAELSASASALSTSTGRRVPLLVKIAPDLGFGAVDDVLSVCVERGIAGVIATNTTVSREGVAVEDAVVGREVGGLSGRPLAGRALEVVSYVDRRMEGRLPIIGVGGIHSGSDAVRMFDAGASLVQVYTGFIYRGPGLVREINRVG